jgi:signal transduction histidine kinase/ActR/RegA family two-component response regulator
MKVQTKIVLLLAAVAVAFCAGVAAIGHSAKARIDRLAQDRAREREKAFTQFLEGVGGPLAMMAQDNSYWDDLVDALTQGNRDWAAHVFDAPYLKTYDANVVWIYNTEPALFFSNNNLYAAGIADAPFPKEALKQIFARKAFCHFFVKIPQGLMEVRGATIHPSGDSQRQSPPRGYFFAGRLWSNASINEMSLFSSDALDIVPAVATPANENRGREGLVAFSYALPGWDGQPVARLAVRNESPLIGQFSEFTWRVFSWLFVCAGALLLAVSIALAGWIGRPLRLLSRGLEKQDLAAIEKLEHGDGEFGGLARVIRRSFEQQRELMRETDERRRTEQALRESEDRLRQSQKIEAVGRLAGGVAHDFNNLLTAIIGYAEMLSEELGDKPALKQYAEIIRKAGEQAASLTRQLLAFSRKQLLQPKIIDFNALIRDMEKLLRRVIGEHITLRTADEAHSPRVKADPVQIEQVVLNLAVNARDAMPRGGTLAIRTANVELRERLANDPEFPPGSYVLLEVSDTGCGMDQDTAARMFEPFFTTKAPGHGTGLGLSTVYGIVKQSGGGIAVESEPGRGAIFRIYLPIEAAPVEEVRPAPAPIEPPSGAPTVLVAEDEEMVRVFVCNVLEGQGCKVLCASHGAEAIAMAREHRAPIHLLVTDVVMPEMNGPELAKRISATRPGIHVLYVSGYSDADITAQGVASEEIEVLEKPFTADALSRKVSEILGARGGSAAQ